MLNARYQLQLSIRFYKRQTVRFSIQLQDSKVANTNSVTRQDGVEKELTREFIHDSLYNPEYGYFSKRALIFSLPRPIDYSQLKNTGEFQDLISSYYKRFDELKDDASAQIWHTPTELFRPHYANAIAEYILRSHEQQQKQHGEQPLVIYEMGAGNGTLMKDVMSYVKSKNPSLYESAEYNIIEISDNLAKKQKLSKALQQHGNVNIINKSIFNWKKVESRRCYFIALEVIDNFAHDVVRWSLDSHPKQQQQQPYETLVHFDSELDKFVENYQPVTDDLIQEYLELRSQIIGCPSPVIQQMSMLDRLRQKFNPFSVGLSEPEWIPTMQMHFFKQLSQYFPRHKLILSDFDSLRTKIPGLNAPIAQTRQRFQMIPCTTYLLPKGWFDIFFATDFELMSSMYRLITQEDVQQEDMLDVQVMKHRDFFLKYGQLNSCKTVSGEVPLLDYYSNVKFMLS
ncbi:hypothetical protein MIR68_011895 [Amoeboaphelidium protococcarum]|nr:hypothetical protein MIR68_011895 [Amoeboaphelidium protococcarum]